MCRSVWALPQMSRWEMKRVQMSMAKAPLEKRRWDWEVLIGRISKGREEKTNCSPPSICFDKFGKGWHQVNWNSLVKGDIISLASKVMLKILQARPQQYVNSEIPDVQAGFRKGRGQEIKLSTSIGSSKKQEGSGKISTFALLPKFLLCQSLWLCGSQQIMENS